MPDTDTTPLPGTDAEDPADPESTPLNDASITPLDPSAAELGDFDATHLSEKDVAQGEDRHGGAAAPPGFFITRWTIGISAALAGAFALKRAIRRNQRIADEFLNQAGKADIKHVADAGALL